MRERTYGQALHEAQTLSMDRDDSVFIMGIGFALFSLALGLKLLIQKI